jgi:hypothetical protein
MRARHGLGGFGIMGVKPSRRVDRPAGLNVSSAAAMFFLTFFSQISAQRPFGQQIRS